MEHLLETIGRNMFAIFGVMALCGAAFMVASRSAGGWGPKAQAASPHCFGALSRLSRFLAFMASPLLGPTPIPDRKSVV